jgi:hypothetical protein
VSRAWAGVLVAVLLGCVPVHDVTVVQQLDSARIAEMQKVIDAQKETIATKDSLIAAQRQGEKKSALALIFKWSAIAAVAILAVEKFTK